MTRKELYSKQYHDIEYDAKAARIKRKLAEARHRKAQKRAAVSQLLLIISWILGIIAAIAVSALDSPGYMAMYIFAVSVALLFGAIVLRDKINDYI